MQKSDYLRQKKLNPGDELRELLSHLEQRPLKFKSMTSTQALILLRELDQVYTLFEEIEANGLSLLPERGRFKTLEARLRKETGPLLKALGGPEALAEHRPKQATPERWWWTIDEMVAAQRKRMLKRLGIGLGIFALLFGGIILAFNTILAPSPEVRLAFEVEIEANTAIEAQDYQRALATIDTGLTKLPNNPTFLIYKGILHQILGEDDEAQQAFAQTQAQLDDPIGFHLARGQLQMQLSRPEQAEMDARAVIDLDENSARGWLLLGRSLQFQGREFEAISAYERAGQLALESGDNEIVVLARLALGQLTGSSAFPQ